MCKCLSLSHIAKIQQFLIKQTIFSIKLNKKETMCLISLFRNFPSYSTISEHIIRRFSLILTSLNPSPKAAATKVSDGQFCKFNPNVCIHLIVYLCPYHVRISYDRPAPRKLPQVRNYPKNQDLQIRH